MDDGVESKTQLMSAEARRLSRAPRILDAFGRSLAANGVVGEARTAKILYLALTSRLLPHPVHVVLAGESATGKSYVVDRVLQFFPASAYYVLPRSSDLFLVYDPEPLAHRMLVVGDAFGRGGALSSSIIGALLAEGRLRYGTVVKNGGAQPMTHRVDKEGPTGVIVDGVAFPLDARDEARCLSVTMDHAPEQRRRVLDEAIAASGDSGGGHDLPAWRQLQENLNVGETRVHIPFAHVVGRSIPPVGARLRRVPAWVRDLVAAHALLHRTTRESGPRGIVATIDDYAVVYALLEETLSESMRVSASWSVQQTVQAVERLLAGGTTSVSLPMLASELGVDRPAASRRVKAAKALGYLRNEETRRGRPARVVLDAPVHRGQPILPKPQQVLSSFADPDHPATNKDVK